MCPREDSQRPARRYDELFQLMQRVENHYQEELRNHQPAVDYLKARGIDGATAKRFRLGFAAAGWSHVLDKFGTSTEATDRLLALGLIVRKDNGKHYDRFRERIMFPIRDSRGRCIGFGGRVLGNEEPKYLNSPETVLFHKRPRTLRAVRGTAGNKEHRAPGHCRRLHGCRRTGEARHRLRGRDSRYCDH